MLCVFWLLHWLAAPPSLFLSLASLFSETQQYCVFFFNMFSFKNIYYLFLAALVLVATLRIVLHCMGSVAVACAGLVAPRHVILVLWPGIKPMSSCIGRQIFLYWPPGKSQDTTILKLVRLTTLQWLLHVQVKRRESHIPLNPKLEVIKLSEEGMWKAETGWKVRPLGQLAKLGM